MAQVSRHLAGRASWPATVVVVVVTMTMRPLAATTPHTHLHLCSPTQREPAGSVPTSGTAVASSHLIPWTRLRCWRSDWPTNTRVHISTCTHIMLAGSREEVHAQCQAVSQIEKKKKDRNNHVFLIGLKFTHSAMHSNKEPYKQRVAHEIN